MTEFLTLESEFLCGHGRKFKIVPPQSKSLVLIEGEPALTVASIAFAKIEGGSCQQPVAPGVLPCKIVLSVLGGAARNCLDKSPLLTTLAFGLTDGIPPIPWRVHPASPKHAFTTSDFGLAAMPAPRVHRFSAGLGKHRVEVELKNEANGSPVAGAEFVVLLSDGRQFHGCLDAKGRGWVEGIEEPGDGKVSFPGIDADSLRRK